jgi:hypothetical protein
MSQTDLKRGGLTAANLKLVIDPKASPDLKTQQIIMQNQAIDSTDKSEIISLVETT